MSNTPLHHPVLLAPVLDGLALKSDSIILDGTYGRGGHAREILDILGPSGRYLAMDKDPQAIEALEAHIRIEPRLSYRHGSFATLDQLLLHEKIEAVDGILLDLGICSTQVDTAERGFSFQKDGPLDMRMNPESGQSAAEWLAHAKEKAIADVLHLYGEERASRRIARAIIETRSKNPLTTTKQLADLIAQFTSGGPGKHPATKSFQGIRIFINSELTDLEVGLDKALAALKPGGRLCVISFHSLEDRIVKRFMQRKAKGDVPKGLPVVESAIPKYITLISKAIRADDEEVRYNPRARSAVLRVAEKK